MEFKELAKEIIEIKKIVEEKIEESGGIEKITKPLIGNNHGFGGILHVTKHCDSGKMNGFHSISSSNLLNVDCLRKMQLEGTVCNKCYAVRSEKKYPSLTDALVWNTVVLTNYSLSENQLPDLFNISNFRFEAFGDVYNLCQLRNYVNICKKNPNTNFSIWTKKIYLFRALFVNLCEPKPQNLTIVYSGTYLNKIPYIGKSLDEIVDIRFTVFTKEFAKENNIEINCEKKCRSCMKCYGRKSNTRNIVDIYELLK